MHLVLTEHTSALTAGRQRDYERLRVRIEQISAMCVMSTHYAEARDLHGAAAVVLSGSLAPWAAHDPAALVRLGHVVGAFGGPVLGICAGMQLQAMFAGGVVGHKTTPRYGFGAVEVIDDRDLMRELPRPTVVYEHHTDEIIELPEGFHVLAWSEGCPVEAISAPERGWWGTQFHPEDFTPEHPAGLRVLRNFFALAGLDGRNGD